MPVKWNTLQLSSIIYSIYNSAVAYVAETLVTAQIGY